MLLLLGVVVASTEASQEIEAYSIDLQRSVLRTVCGVMFGVII